jgi:hypothetical protein
MPAAIMAVVIMPMTVITVAMAPPVWATLIDHHRRAVTSYDDGRWLHVDRVWRDDRADEAADNASDDSAEHRVARAVLIGEGVHGQHRESRASAQSNNPLSHFVTSSGLP